MENFFSSSTNIIMSIFFVVLGLVCIAMVFDSIAQKARAARDIRIADYRERQAERRKKRVEEPKPNPEDEP